MEDDDYVVEIFGSSGEVINKIGFKTLKGKTWEVGAGGGSPFSLIAT